MPNPELVSNDPLRAAYERSDLSAAELAKRVGILRRYFPDADGDLPLCRDGEVIREGVWGGDGTAAMRDLGLRPSTTSGRAKKPHYVKRRINIEKALRYAEVLGIDPVDLGL